ncbi:MAG TPA: prepilin-type N-terminal cleavage/methylation domain-containing protein [Noviherbaspirillum sp.]|nr:prepilin-type N-terminal cleavage/methylation domain-containing protein [Noviherbaspirillum sp.]
MRKSTSISIASRSIKANVSIRLGHLAFQQAFTLVELIGVIIIVGILAVAAIPRFFQRTTFDARSFSDQTLAVLRYAQKSAIAQRRTVCVAFSAPNVVPATVTLTIASTFGGACDVNLKGPNGVEPYSITSVEGVSFTSLTPNVTTNFFTPLGQAGIGHSIQVSGAPQPITIEQETGYVH